MMRPYQVPGAVGNTTTSVSSTDERSKVEMSYVLRHNRKGRKGLMEKIGCT